MRKLSIICLAVLIVSTVNFKSMAITYYINDGQPHTIDYAVQKDLQIDDSSEGAQTIVSLETGALINGHLETYDSSILNINDCYIVQHLSCHDGATININGGYLANDLFGYDYSTITINGGRIASGISVTSLTTLYLKGGIAGSHLYIRAQSKAFFSGGSVAGALNIVDEGTLTIDGSDFQINGLDVPLGEYTIADYFDSHRITGILANGDLLNNDFKIDSDYAKLVLIPEPATIGLLAIGGLILRKRKP